MNDFTTMLEDNSFDIFLEYKNYIDEINNARRDTKNKKEDLFKSHIEVIKNKISQETAYQGDDPENVINACLYLAINSPQAIGLIYNITRLLATNDFSSERVAYFIGCIASITLSCWYESRTNKNYHGYMKEFIFRLSVILKAIKESINK